MLSRCRYCCAAAITRRRNITWASCGATSAPSSLRGRRSNFGTRLQPQARTSNLEEIPQQNCHNFSSDHSRTQPIIAKQITGHADGHESDVPGSACCSFFMGLRLYRPQLRHKQIIMTYCWSSPHRVASSHNTVLYTVHFWNQKCHRAYGI